MDFVFINNLAVQAKNVYHVDPRIFILIYIIATPTYYFGIYLAAKGVFKYRRACKQKKKKINIHDLFIEKKFVDGYLLNRGSWIAPYVYVIFWGENLPFKFYSLLLVWMLLSTIIFSHSLKHKYLKSDLKKPVN